MSRAGEERQKSAGGIRIGRSAAPRSSARPMHTVCSQPSRMAAHGCVDWSARSSIGGLLGSSNLTRSSTLSLTRSSTASLTRSSTVSRGCATASLLHERQCRAAQTRQASVHARRWSIEACHSPANVNELRARARSQRRQSADSQLGRTPSGRMRATASLYTKSR